MSASETDSDPEPELGTDTVASLTTFANSFVTRPSYDPSDEETVSWAVDTLATLDFRLVRKDDALHGLVQNCANRILALFDTVLQLESATDRSCNLMSDVASLLRPSFLHLLFQYRRLFRMIAAKDFKPNSTPLAIVCWVDVVLARLCDVITHIAVGPDRRHFDHSLPESLKTHREEDNLRAAIQLPDNWDMLPSVLISDRASVAAKRLSVKLMLGRYIFYPVLSAQVGVDNAIHQLLSTFSEFVRQSAARVGELRSVSGPDLRFLVQQERLMGAMTITLFAAADMAQNAVDDVDHVVAFRPQTMAAAIQLLRFALDEEGYPTQMNILNPLEHLDIPSSVIIRWGIVPQWTWSIWLDHRNLYADTIMHVTTAYIQHHSAGSGVLEITDLMPTNSSNQAAVVNVMADLISRFISVLSAEGHSTQLSAGTTNVLYGSCRLMSQWMNHNTCGIQDSKECCKVLMVLFGCLCQNEQHYVANDLVIECLSLVKGQCIREAWKAAAEDSRFRFFEALDQSFMQAKTALSRNGLSKLSERHAVQLMQFLIVMISKRVEPLNMAAFVELVQAAGNRAPEMPPNEREFLCETLLTCLAVAKISGIDLPFNEVTVATDEAMWHLGAGSRDVNFFLASAFSLYITSAPVCVEPLTYLETLEHLLNMVLLICARQLSREDEPLALIVLPTICDALAHLLDHQDDTTGLYTCANIRMAALGNVLRSLSSREDSGYDGILRRRLPRWLFGEYVTKERGAREYEVVFCRMDGVSHMLVRNGGVT